MSSPILLTEGIDAGAAWHHGNPVAEQRAMLAGRAGVDLGHHDVLAIDGPDRLSWLQGLTTQELVSLPPRTASDALVLSPTGHIEHVLHAVDDGERLWVRTEPGRGAALVGWLDSMRFMMRVEVSSLSDQWRAAWWGSALQVPQSAVAVHASRLGDGSELLLPREAPLAPAVPAGVWAWEALRIEAGVPRIGLDTDARTIPNELGLYATHLDKGCYRGQETVARVYNLGRPPRRLVQLHLDGSLDRMPQPGASISDGTRDVGFVGGSARHHELGPVALGLIKRSVGVEVPLLVDGIAASQQALVDPEVGLHIRHRATRSPDRVTR